MADQERHLNQKNVSSPLLTKISPEETTILVDRFANKQHLVESKDLGNVYRDIYEEKVQQVWRFPKIDLATEDHDDEYWYDSDVEDEEPEANEASVA